MFQVQIRIFYANTDEVHLFIKHQITKLPTRYIKIPCPMKRLKYVTLQIVGSYENLVGYGGIENERIRLWNNKQNQRKRVETWSTYNLS